MAVRRRYEKSDSVLWAFTPGGIVLHNFSSLRFLELDEAGHLIWSYLDGVHGPLEIQSKLIEHFPDRFTAPDVEILVARMIGELLDGGFIREFVP